MSYTKGKWILDKDKKQCPYNIYKKCTDCGDTIKIAQTWTRGNATLIASAPKLLEACKKVRGFTTGEYWKAGQIVSGEDIELLMFIKRTLNEAINQAEGGQDD